MCVISDVWTLKTLSRSFHPPFMILQVVLQRVPRPHPPSSGGGRGVHRMSPVVPPVVPPAVPLGAAGTSSDDDGSRAGWEGGRVLVPHGQMQAGES